MDNAKKANEVPYFRREDGVWVRTAEEKGSAFLERYLKQTDQQNKDYRLNLMCRLGTYYESQDSFMFPHDELWAEVVKNIITQADDTSPGPDGTRYSDLGSLSEDEMQALTDIFNASPADHSIQDDWLDSHLSPVPKPEKDQTSIKGYRIVTMQNTVEKLLVNIVARRLLRQHEDKGLLPATLESHRPGKDTWANAAVLASDVYDAFERKKETRSSGLGS